MKRFLTIALVLIGLTSLPTADSFGGGQAKKDKDKKESITWMKAKMSLSSDILLGLTEGDFAKIKSKANALNVVHYLEGWFPAPRQDYKQQMALFTAANQELIKQADAKNIYGATLAFNQLTVTCVQCHVIVRDAKK